MTSQLHSVDSVARVLGRFEMHITPSQVSTQTHQPHYGVEADEVFGFSSAASIRAFVGEVSPGPRPETLNKFAKRVGGSWSVDLLAIENSEHWRRLLKTDTPIVIEAPEDHCWVSRRVERLFTPMIYYTGSASLSEGSIKFCRRRLKERGGLLFVTSPWNRCVTIFGRGQLFEYAVECMAKRPADVWGYTDSQRVDILRGGFRLFRAALL